MTQEEKDLLLKDLCGRLPYGVKFQSENIETAFFVDTSDNEVWINGTCIDDFKPYLFPLSSMTDEQKYTCPIGVANLDTFIKNESWTYLEITPDSILCLIDWLNKNHFDYRGLIEKGLAIDVTGKNIY